MMHQLFERSGELRLAGRLCRIYNWEHAITQGPSGNYFLSTVDEPFHVLGAADRNGDRWFVTVSRVYDPETDTDVELVWSGDDEMEAIRALWNTRYMTKG